MQTMMLQAVCLSVSVVLVVVQCQVLYFKRQLTSDSIYCGHLQCVANSSQTIINMAIYDTTEKGNPVKLASISLFAPEAVVDPSKAHVINATGAISTYDGILNVSFLRDIDCLYGAFQCQLDFVNINDQPDVIRENLAPATEENATIVYSLVKIATQLKEHSEETDKQLGALKQDNAALKQDNEVLKQEIGALKQDNQALKTVLDSILMTVSRIDGILNSTLDQDQQIGRWCYRGMPHKSSRERFVLARNVHALCDTETDGGGWVVIQRRVRGDVDFYRSWDDYKKGFGNPETDFWIGNDNIHNLTSQGYNELRIDFIHDQTEYFAQYTNFTVADESSEYLLAIGGFFGNVFDSMNIHDGYKFSTFDRDNDVKVTNCAVEYHGAWWYRACYHTNLNGAWADTNLTGISWYDNKTDFWTSLPFTEMKIRYI